MADLQSAALATWLRRHDKNIRKLASETEKTIPKGMVHNLSLKKSVGKSIEPYRFFWFFRLADRDILSYSTAIINLIKKRSG
jgi:hypothetical protein